MESENVLQIRRTFNARAQKVFEAWTTEEHFSRWFPQNAKHKVLACDMDVRPGGTYRVEIQSPDGRLKIVTGTYREVVAPQKLVFSWKWESDPEHGETEITLEFVSKGNQTELTLTQKFFPSRESRDDHAKGWSNCLDHLNEFLR